MQPEPELKPFQRVQQQFAGHIRDPAGQPPPAGIEDRRMEIYRGLFYRNIEGFISSAFPVLHSILPTAHWDAMIRDFMVRHRCRTPYFLEISQEFIRYLQEERQAEAGDPPFMLELAHYEWVELALDIADVEPPWSSILANGDLLQGAPVVSPTAWSLSYSYPVHRIGREYQPSSPPDQATFLIVYRNREDRVKFMVTNAVTARLLELIVEGEDVSGQQALQSLATEMKQEATPEFCRFGLDILSKLQAAGIVLGVRRPV